MKQQINEDDDLRFSSALLFTPSNSCGSIFSSVKPNDDLLVFVKTDNSLIATFEVKNIAPKSLIAFHVLLKSHLLPLMKWNLNQNVDSSYLLNSHK